MGSIMRRILLFGMAASSAYAVPGPSAGFGWSRNATTTPGKWTSIQNTSTIRGELPPTTFTSTDSIDDPSESIMDSSSTKSPSFWTARSSMVANGTSRASPEPEPANTILPPKSITNNPDDSTPESKPIPPITSQTLVALSMQTPAADSTSTSVTNILDDSTPESKPLPPITSQTLIALSMQTPAAGSTSTFTSTPPKETQQQEASTSATENSLPGIVTTHLAVPEWTTVLQPPLSNPPSPSGLSPEPVSGHTGLGQQTPSIQTPTMQKPTIQTPTTQTPIIQTPTISHGQQQTLSPLPIFATSILVKEATEEVAQPTPPVITFGTNTYSPAGSSAVYLINGQTLAPGGAAITISNSVLSLATSPNEAIEAVVPATPPVITFGTNTYSPVGSSAVYLINGQTLAPGGAAVTVANSILSLAPSATQLIVAPTGFVSSGQAVSPASTIRLIWDPSSTSLPIAPSPTSAPTPVIATIENSPVTLYPGVSSLVYTPLIGSPVTILPGAAAQTLPGGAIVSLSPAGSSAQSGPAPPILIISDTGASTAQTITFPNVPSPSGTAPPVLIISDTGASTAQTITFPNVPSPGSLGTPASVSPPMIPYSNYIPIRISDPPFIVVDNSITLTPGAPAATASGGIPISLGTSNSVLVVGSSTITLAPTATGIGGYLYSALEAGNSDEARTGSGSGSRSTSGSKLAPGSLSATTSTGTGPGTGIVTSTLSASRGENDVSSTIPSPTQSQPRSSDAVQQSNAVARSVTFGGRGNGSGKMISWLLSLLLTLFVVG